MHYSKTTRARRDRLLVIECVVSRNKTGNSKIVKQIDLVSAPVDHCWLHPPAQGVLAHTGRSSSAGAAAEIGCSEIGGPATTYCGSSSKSSPSSGSVNLSETRDTCHLQGLEWGEGSLASARPRMTAPVMRCTVSLRSAGMVRMATTTTSQVS